MSNDMPAYPLISVIIPYYNTEQYLAEAIESALDQTYPAVELILVDDGSTDESATVAGGYIPRVTCISQANAGSSAARNRGVEVARGEFFAFLDADDIWVPEKLMLQFRAFRSNPELDVVYGHVEQFYSPELGEAFRKRVQCPDGQVPGYCSSTILVSARAFRRVGRFDPGIIIGEDMDWYLRAQECGLHVKMLPEMVCRRRLHEHNKGMRLKQFDVQRVRILKAALDRRRTAINTSHNEKAGPDSPSPGPGGDPVP